MSPRAACRLESLGFEEVYDFVAGKADWLAHGQPTEGDKAVSRRAIDFVRDDVIRCGLDERMADVRPRVDASPYGFALVVAGRGILLGRLRKAALAGDPAARAEAVMEPGPSTIRPDLPAEELARRLDRRNLTTAVVTTPDGALVGVVLRSKLPSGAQ